MMNSGGKVATMAIVARLNNARDTANNSDVLCKPISWYENPYVNIENKFSGRNRLKYTSESV